MATDSVILESPTITEAERLTAVRTLAGKISTDGMDDEEIFEKMARWDNWVYVMTDKFDWPTDLNNPKIDQVINVSNLMTSAEILNGIGDDVTVKTAVDQRQLASKTIRAINKKDEDQNNFEIVSGGYNITNELDSANYIEEQTEFG